jgi:acyl-CoA thioester hydrolase
MKQLFKHHIVVNPEHIDFLKHVNNEVYLTWLLESAAGHSNYLGFSIERYLSSGSCFVVRRHEIDYLAPAFLGDKLVVETWVKEMHAKKSTRAYRIKREQDNKIIVNAETRWVYVDLKTGRPKEIPIEVLDAFQIHH